MRAYNTTTYSLSCTKSYHMYCTHCPNSLCNSNSKDPIPLQLPVCIPLCYPILRSLSNITGTYPVAQPSNLQPAPTSRDSIQWPAGPTTVLISKRLRRLGLAILQGKIPDAFQNPPDVRMRKRWASFVCWKATMPTQVLLYMCESSALADV